MGDPKFSRKKFARPTHPWIADRITEEREIGKKYGLKSKRELWKMQAFLHQCRGQARSLQAKLRLEDEQAKKETSLLLRRLTRLGVLKEGTGSVDEVLALNLDMVLGRRLESIVFYKGLARSPKQSRQFITHGHITVKARRVTIPGYMVRKDEEDKIAYHPRSPFMDPAHPLRKPPEEVTAEKETKALKEVLKEATEAPKETAREEKPKEEKPKEGAEEKKAEEPKKEEKKKPDEAKHEEKKKHQEEKKEKKGDEK
jgi:small subunit ribosomal protein S4